MLRSSNPDIAPRDSVCPGIAMRVGCKIYLFMQSPLLRIGNDNLRRMRASGSMRAEANTTVGRIASVLSVIMYVSYLTQIANNLGGNPGSPWQPLCAFFNCTMCG